MAAAAEGVEVQGAGEESTFSPEQLQGLLVLAQKGLRELAAIQAGEREIVIAGDPADPRTRALLATAQRHPRAGAALSLAACAPDLPLHQGRLGAEPLAYVCQGGACQRPTADPAELRTLLV